MFKKNIITLLIFYAGCIFSLNAQSSEKQEEGFSLSKLYEYIDRYLELVPPEIDSLKIASDYIIAFSDDIVVQSSIAGYLFNRFVDSPVMGYEEIAIYIAKNYFLNDKLRWSGDGGMVLLSTFVEFNENSLIGMDAPELVLQNIYGADCSLRALKSNYVVICFFDEDCPVCKETLPLLKNIIADKEYLDIEVFAVYTQHDAKRLETFISGTPFPSNWHFVMDMENSSNFHRLYNVLTTPRIFLLDGQKRIIGRNLDPTALHKLLEFEQDKVSMLNEDAEALVKFQLHALPLKDTTALEKVIAPLFDIINRQNDRMMYNILFYHFFEYLVHSEDEYAPEAALYLTEKYIIPYDSLWRDRLFYEERVPLFIERIKANMIGAIIDDLTLYKPNGKRVALHGIKSKRYTYLYFFNPNCAICEPFGYELEKVYRKLKKSRVKVVAIYTGESREELSSYLISHKVPWDILWVGDTGNAVDLYYKFEIDKVPQTYLLNREKRIIAKRINTIQLQEITER